MNREESDIRHLRQAYQKGELNEAKVNKNPFRQFDAWFQDAVDAENIIEPNAMTLATATSAGKPAARTVLLKEVTNNGFVFYTNYESKKGHDLEENPNAALLFFWDRLERQIRIEGRVEKIPGSQSDEYFAARPKGSRLGAIASPQSKVIEGRKALEASLEQLNQQYAETDDIPRPEHWGGYILIPEYFEFWQGRLNRLHDRITYKLTGENWLIERLAP